MKLLPEVWAVIFSFLSHNDLTEVSVVCKLFYYLSQKNAGFVEKLSHSRLLFSGFNFQEHFRDACLSLAGQFADLMNKDFKEDVFFKAKEIIMNRLIFSILPFRVWNHMSFCSRSYYSSDICLLCTRVNISHRAVSNYIDQKLFVPITHFHPSIREGIVMMEKKNFFVYYHGALERHGKDTQIILLFCPISVLALRFYSIQRMSLTKKF